MTKENKHFKIQSVNECVWLSDKRGHGKEIHLTKGQAKKLGEMLLGISE